MGDTGDGRTASAAQARQANAGKRRANNAWSARMATAKASRSNTPSPGLPQEEYSDLQQATHDQLSREVQQIQRQRSRTPPSRLGFEPIPVDEPEWYEEATGCRLMDLDLFNEHITRLLPCPKCGSVALFCRAADEYRAGLGGHLAFWCAECEEVTHKLPLCGQVKQKAVSSRALPGPGVSEANLRLALGAAQIGAGETQMAQLFGTLNVPVVRGTTWAAAEDRVTEAVNKAAEDSRRAARLEEKRAAFDRGTPVDADGKVPITVEYDMCWAKRSSGKAYNSLEGSGSALGAVTGKVLVSRVMKKDCDKCKKNICDRGAGCNINYSGSAGGMESKAGGDMLMELAQDAHESGIRLQRYVTDLDAKTAAAMRTKSDEAGVDLPEQKYDPGHWKKGFGKDLIAIKKSTGITNVLGTDDQAVLRGRVSQCISQFRECGSVDRFTAALWNVFDHIFGRHERCRSFFKCPAAIQGSTHVPPFKLKAWLPTGGKLEELLRAAFAKLTERKMVLGLMHGGSTQRVESLNHVRATIRPKYQHHAGSNVADQRHNLGDLRWNDGRFGSTDATLTALGIETGVGACGEHALRYLDEESRKDSERKRTIDGKRRRKRNRKKRSTDTNAVEDGAYGPQAEREEVTTLKEIPPPPAALAAAAYTGTLDATVPMPATALVASPPLPPAPLAALPHVGAHRPVHYTRAGAVLGFGAHGLPQGRHVPGRRDLRARRHLDALGEGQAYTCGRGQVRLLSTLH